MKTFCDDWGCPSWVSCARHFGRSREYSAMDHETPVRFRAGPRAKDEPVCSEYRRDTPRPWLMRWWGGDPVEQIADPPE